MSERGTFVTSFLYDLRNLSPVLRAELPKVCRPGTLVESHRCSDPSLPPLPWFYAGMMHGSYPDEEPEIMRWFIVHDLLPALPAEHGVFSISVLPDSEESATVFTIHNRHMREARVGAFAQAPED